MFDERLQKIAKLMLLLDLFAISTAYYLSYELEWRIYLSEIKNLKAHILVLPMLLLTYWLVAHRQRVYQDFYNSTVYHSTFKAVKSLLVSIVFLLTMIFLFQLHDISRFIIGTFFVLGASFLTGVRIGILKWHLPRTLQSQKNKLRILIIGTGSRAKKLLSELKENSMGFEVVGYLDPEPNVLASGLDAPILGTVKDIHEILKNNIVDEVILAIPRTLIPNVEDIAAACEEEGIKLRMMADVFDLKVARMNLVRLGKIPLLTLEPVAQDELMLYIKRLLDIVITLAILPAALPIMAVIALAIKLDSPGPVFFVQERVGYKKRTFKMYKFRSMYVGSEERQKELEHLNEAEGPIFKIKNDPRVTRVGKILRKTSLDELPQLFNVIKGDMSLVGPRPMSLRDVSRFDKGIQRKRFSVKPGITCLWQISGRSELPFSKWLELDLKYIENWSIILDLKILLKTIPAVIKCKGAV